MLIHRFLFIIVTILIAACSSSSDDDGTSTTTGSGSPWSIPVGQVLDGGPGKDGIPSIDNPQFIDANQTNLFANELIIGVKQGNDIKAYPHNIMNWHEIVNDIVNNESLTISFCPLTGSSLLWRAPQSFTNKAFGVSGLLYNSNLILYDRQSDSNWSQMLIESVNGTQIGTIPENLSIVETSWGTWQQMYPNTMVLSEQTGFSRNYSTSPYGDYPTNSSLLFPADNLSDTRLHVKARVLGIAEGNVNKIYPITDFAPDMQIINELLDNTAYVIAGSSGFNFAVAFRSTLEDQTTLDFTAVQGSLPIIMQDQEGNQWDIFGVAVSGPRTGQILTPSKSFIAYWFAWSAFYANPEIHSF